VVVAVVLVTTALQVQAAMAASSFTTRILENK